MELIFYTLEMFIISDASFEKLRKQNVGTVKAGQVSVLDKE